MTPTDSASRHHPKRNPDPLSCFATIHFPVRQTDRPPHRPIDGIGDGSVRTARIYALYIDGERRANRLITIVITVKNLHRSACRLLVLKVNTEHVSVGRYPCFRYERFIGRPYYRSCLWHDVSSVCLSSVCLSSSVTFCIVAKRYVLAENCLKEQIGNPGQKVDFLGRRHISTSGFAVTATETAVFALFLPVQPSKWY